MRVTSPAAIECTLLKFFILSKTLIGSNVKGGRPAPWVQRRNPVVGVAKSRFDGARAVEVYRGGSIRPLYVSAAGLDPEEAAEKIRSMHGRHRVPTLLKRVDRLARDYCR
jgi:deoxyribonuclease V